MTQWECQNPKCGHVYKVRKENPKRRRCPKCFTTRVSPFVNQNENNPNAMMKDDNEIPDLENDLEIAKERREIELLKVKAEKARLMKEIAGCKAQIEMNEMIDDLMTRVAQNEEWLTALTEDKDELSDKLDRFRSEYDNLALKFYLRNRSKI